ncbi:hypothetical protein PN450_11180, partial [Dolichospermum lemmermannii CS-548]|uniref:hypothetical protein n=1 Tax=Dolichospermum lemmermannii TaxID=54295 RepID=UPI00232C3057
SQESGVRSQESGVRSQESGEEEGRRRKKEEGRRKKEEGRRKKEEEGNFFLCFSYLVNGYILYLSMHLHVLANVVMLNLLS